MPAYSLKNKAESSTSFVTSAADAQLVGRMRLVLSVSVVLAVFIDPSGLSATQSLTWLVFFGYLFHSAVIYICSQLDHPLSHSILIHRLDILWFALIIICTGGVNSFFFLFFFFAILTSSFRWGFEEGAKVTIASAVLFIACGLILEEKSDLPRLLLRTTFLLTIGYLSVYWGESKVRLVHQLLLLRDVSRLSNPRFGVDHTITNVLEKTRLFYKASSCILVMEDKESGACSLRTVKEGNATQSITADPLSVKAASLLMTHSVEHLIVYTRPFWRLIAFAFTETSKYDSGQHRWSKLEGPLSESLAELLEARCFISAPLVLRKQRGRIYVISNKETFNKEDTLFLSHIAAQAFPVIENIEVLDRMATDAALQEREKLSLDIHDRTIQPYIGLKLGLSAIRKYAAEDNPLTGQIDKLMRMTEKVIVDMRHYAVTFKTGSGTNEPILSIVLNQQAAQIKKLYGIDIAITIKNEFQISDRLTAEILQFVREGLSNICRHTLSQRGFVTLYCADERLQIEIENECANGMPTCFLPRSISARAAGLGGSVRVSQASQGNTVVHIEIPV